MNNFKVYTIGVLLSLPILSAQAQMVNRGKMKIEKGTNNVITLFDFTNDKAGDFTNNDSFHIMKDYENLGKVIDGEGTTLFKGSNKDSDKKKINAGSTSYFYNVVFDSPYSSTTDGAAFDLSGEMNIVGQADFKRGIVNNRKTAGVISFLENGTTVGASDESYVNGKVEKIGKTAFSEFPIGAYGTKQYRYAGISAPNDANHSVVAEYFLEESDSKYSHDKKDSSILKIDNNEYWEITGTQNLILTLSWDDDTTPSDFLNNPKAIRIARWDTSLNQWKDLGGIPDESTRTVSTPVTGEGIFTLAMVEELEDGEMEIFNAITPNGDNLNDSFAVVFKKGTKVNKLAVKIYNRWGVEVYHSDKYQSDEANTFYGYSNGRMVIDKGSLLSKGTYYYILDYDYTTEAGTNHNGTKVGYLYITGEQNIKNVL